MRSGVIGIVNGLVDDVKNGKINPEDIDEKYLGKYMYTADVPEVDLIISTGTSNPVQAMRA